MRYRLVIWDFDGTLADTLSVSLRIYNDLARKHGYQQVHDPVACRDLTAMQLLRLAGIPIYRVPMLIREIAAGQRAVIAEVPLFPGIPDAVRKLHAAGCQMVIVSTNSEQNVRTCLAAHGVEGCFELVTGYTRFLGKQSAIRRLLRQQRIDPDRAIYIGDEVRDVEAANDAGIDAAAVCWGVNSRALLATLKPTWLVADADQLGTMIASWLD